MLKHITLALHLYKLMQYVEIMQYEMVVMTVV